jgi:hypothetical protein
MSGPIGARDHKQLNWALGATRVTKHFLDENDVLRLLHEEVDRAGGQSAWARRSGVDRVYLNRVLNGKRPLSPRIVKALKLKRVFAYEK